MKVLILGVALCLSRVAAEAPYPPSGWRPNGPSFELPEKQKTTTQDSYGPPSQNQRNPSSEYGAPDDDQSDPGLTVQGLTPRGQTDRDNGQQNPGQLSQGQQTQGQLPQGEQAPGQLPHSQQAAGQFFQVQRTPGQFTQDQRTPGKFSPSQQTPGQFSQGQQTLGQFPQGQQTRGQIPQGWPASGQLSQGQKEEGQFAQGLPVQEATPLFTVSPVNGQQYVGSTFNADLRLLEEQLRQQEAQRQRFSNFDTQQESFRKDQSNANGYDDFQYQQNPSQIAVTESNHGFGAPNIAGTNTGFGSTDNPQNTRFGSPTTVSPTRFGHPSQFPQRPTNQSFGEGATPKQTNEEPGIYFRKNAPESPKISSLPAKDDDKEATTERDGTPQDSKQSPSFQPPANYPNQLVQLALLQQYSSMPFTQPIGQIRAPIYYQPAQAFPSNLMTESQQFMPAEGQQQFMPRGQGAQQPFMSVGEQEGQIGQQQFMPMGGQQPFMSGGQQSFTPMLGQQGQQQFIPMGGQGQQTFLMSGQSGQQTFTPMFVQSGQQQLMPAGGQPQSSLPGQQGRQPQAPQATYGLLPDRQDGTTPPAQRGQTANNLPPPRFNVPNSQQQPAQAGQITQFLLSGNAPGLNPFAELMEAYFTSQRSLQEQRRTQGPQGLQLLDGEPTLRQVLLEDIPSFTQALLSGFAQPSQLDITQPGLSSPRADVMRENIANDGLPASSFQQNAVAPQNAYRPGVRQPLVQGNQNEGFNQRQQPGAIQSGFDANQQGNAVDSSRPRVEDDGEQPEETNDDFGTPTADAPGFGDRLPARGFSAYGAPRPQQQYGATARARPQDSGVDAEPPTATDVPRTDAEVSPTEDSTSMAVANAVADGRKRKSSKLRSRRIRPLYTVDRTGQLIQLQ